MNTLLTLFILAACVAPLYALDCYSCGYVTGVGGADCLDTFDTSTVNSSSDVSTATCTGQCSKTSVTVSSEVTALARACVASCTAGCVSLFGIRTCTNCCSTDNCNSATNVQMSIIAMMVALLLALGISR
ncbi:ly-6/neurotoxin-like protein 1 [Lytechinus pictus]|uniref:ly-6/neurotoxin-like protein 1 n=1 Tax=Lytechinus pictus TaxID=7653 RepID=UPI0030B9CC1C